MLSVINYGAISIKSVTLKGKLLHWYINYTIYNNIDHRFKQPKWLFIQIPYKSIAFDVNIALCFLAIYLLNFRENDWNIKNEVQLRINQNYSEWRDIMIFVKQWIVFLFVDHVKAKFLKRSCIIYTYKYEATKMWRLKKIYLLCCKSY